MNVRLHIALLVAPLFLFGCAPTSTGPAFAPLPGWHAYPNGLSAITGFSPHTDDFASTATATAVRQRVVADGFHWLRFDLNWERLETAKGHFAWQPFDERVSTVRTEGFEPLAVLLYGNKLYVDNPEECRTLQRGSTKCISDIAAFARYAGAVAAHYRGQISTYEIWNEANGWFRFWSSKWGGDPAAYARLLLAAEAAIHAVCPECTVLSGGLVYLDFSPVVFGQATFMPAMIRAQPSLFSRLDGVGVHYYTRYPPVAPPESNLLGEVPLDIVLDNTHDQCACNKPLWITETGWTASGGLSRRNQARYGVRGLLIAAAKGARSWLWWSIMQPDAAGLIAPQEAKFGVMTHDGKPNLVYTALARTLRELGSATEVRDERARYGLRQPSEWAVRLRFANGSEKLVYWANTDGNYALPDSLPQSAGLNLITGKPAAAGTFGGDPVVVDLQ